MTKKLQFIITRACIFANGKRAEFVIDVLDEDNNNNNNNNNNSDNYNSDNYNYNDNNK